jgi:hypothetical protein
VKNPLRRSILLLKQKENENHRVNINIFLHQVEEREDEK